MHKILRYTIFSETPNCSATTFFGTVWQKFSREKRDTPPSVMHKFWRYLNFLKLWRDAHEFFRHCDTKIFWGKNVIAPIMHNFFRYPNFFETMKGRSRNSSAMWDQKFLTEKRDTPLFIQKFFSEPGFFQKHRIPSRKSSVLWDNKFSIAICDIPLLCIEFLDTRNFLKHRRVPRQRFSALWDKNFPSKKSWHSSA